MIANLAALMPEGTSWSDPDGGMFCWVRLPGAINTTAMLANALEHQVAYVPGRAFFACRPDDATLRLSFVTNPPEVIADGLWRRRKTNGEAGL
jgi:DNA-binding transcriptional MocR family regulator